MIKLTPSLKKALEILRDNPEITAYYFAMKMWGDSPAWRHHLRCGNGVQAGKGMWLCAGSYLSKLKRKGLVYRDLKEHGLQWIFSISYEGRELLKEK